MLVTASRPARLLATLALLLLAAGCGGGRALSGDLDAGPGVEAGAEAAPASPDAAPGGHDAAVAETDGPVTPGDDGTPTRVQCTSQYGTGLTTAHGRLDGFLVAMVEPGHGGCNADSNHLHLQVQMQGAVYDVAVNVNSDQSTSDPTVYLKEWDGTLPDGAWAEGWHPDFALDYTTLGLSSTDFTSTPLAPLAQLLTDGLGQVNHISVFATGYGPDGLHLVHRQGSGRDGAIVVRPLDDTPHFYFFHFATQTF
jgi:hypothetical protein